MTDTERAVVGFVAAMFAVVTFTGGAIYFQQGRYVMAGFTWIATAMGCISALLFFVQIAVRSALGK